MPGCWGETLPGLLGLLHAMQENICAWGRQGISAGATRRALRLCCGG